MPTRPPPPDPYETWLDWILCDYCDFTCTDSRNKVETAKAELAELRAERDKYKPFYDAVVERHTRYSKASTLPPPETPQIAIAELIDEAEEMGRISAMLDPDAQELPDPADEYLRTARKA